MKTADEIVDCVECGATYNLAAQRYYGPHCPDCTRERDPSSLWPSCYKCQSRYPPEDMEPATVHTPGYGTERLTICAGCVAKEARRGGRRC